MPKYTNTYQYKSNDTPLTVAQQFGVSPQDLINANPGGWPFSVGQTIRLPKIPAFAAFQSGQQTAALGAGSGAVVNAAYNTAINPGLRPGQTAAAFGLGGAFAPAAIPSAANTALGFGNPLMGIYSQNVAYGVSPYSQQIAGQLQALGGGARGSRTYGTTGSRATPMPAGYYYGQQLAQQYAAGATVPNFGFSPTAGTRNILYRIAEGRNVKMTPQNEEAVRNILGIPQTNTGIGTGTGGTPGPGQFYGYVQNPETGRSERVIKNSSESSFLNEKRWDPQAKKYVSIGKLLKQGKLDLKGNWSNKSKRQKRNESNSRQQQAQKKIDFTLANSLISFGGGSG
jgi:hypothetical protein